MMNGQVELEQLLEQATEVLREAPAGIPEKFWNRRPRIEGHNPNDWELLSTRNGTVTIQTIKPVKGGSSVFVPTIRPVRIAQRLPGLATITVEHRLSLTPPRSIYATYSPIRFEYMDINAKHTYEPPNRIGLAAGARIGQTPTGAPKRFYVCFLARRQIGLSDFRTECPTTAPTPPPTPTPSPSPQEIERQVDRLVRHVQDGLTPPQRGFGDARFSEAVARYLSHIEGYMMAMDEIYGNQFRSPPLLPNVDMYYPNRFHFNRPGFRKAVNAWRALGDPDRERERTPPHALVNDSSMQRELLRDRNFGRIRRALRDFYNREIHRLGSG